MACELDIYRQAKSGKPRIVDGIPIATAIEVVIAKSGLNRIIPVAAVNLVVAVINEYDVVVSRPEEEVGTVASGQIRYLKSPLKINLFLFRLGTHSENRQLVGRCAG